MKKILLIVIALLIFNSCSNSNKPKTLENMSSNELLQILSKEKIEEEWEESYITDAGQHVLTLKINNDKTFDYTYKKVYKGATRARKKVKGFIEFLGNPKLKTENSRTFYEQNLNLILQNNDFDLQASLIQWFKNDGSVKNEIFFSQTYTNQDQLKKISNYNLKLPSKNFSLNGV